MAQLTLSHTHHSHTHPTAPPLTEGTPTIPACAHYTSEWLSAIVAAGLVAPLVSIVDKSIIANASGTQPLMEGLKSGLLTLLKRPSYFFRQPSFLMIWGVYGGTYIVANSVESMWNRKGQPSAFPKFVGSSSANITLSIMKDKAFARMFGKGDPRPFPKLSYGLFAFRDSITIAASFTIPPVVSARLQRDWNLSKSTGDVVAQLITPCALQVFSTPFHLIGLDLYNNPSSNFSQRAGFLRAEYTKTMFARMGRIFPAFGIGGVANKKLRGASKHALERYYDRVPALAQRRLLA
eukprot:comp5854_c0_seq1/m.1718 comp5854_c0_seq1/g.1718  ORF comp5854_c0_seq1/g.1718 comp5854_c0_seq1/m.1718 type:complete len:293 (-) comp5854_c0_seq1:192-1070(-)